MIIFGTAFPHKEPKAIIIAPCDLGASKPYLTEAEIPSLIAPPVYDLDSIWTWTLTEYEKQWI